MLEDILQIDADIQMPEIPESSSSKKRNILDDKDDHHDPDNGSSSGSPPPNKQSKQEPEDDKGNHNSNGNTENGDGGSDNGFGSDDNGEFRQNSIQICPVADTTMPPVSKGKFSNFHLPISPPHDVVFDDDEFDNDEDEYDDVPLPLLEPETQIEDGPEMSEELRGIIENGADLSNDIESSNGTFKLKISSVKENQKSNSKSAKITSMRFGQFNTTGNNSTCINKLEDVQDKTELEDDECFSEPGPSQATQLKSKKKTQQKFTKGTKKSSQKGLALSSTGGLLRGNENELISAAEFEVKQEMLDMQDSSSLPLEEREIKQENLEDEMRQAFDYYGKNTPASIQQGMNLPLPPNLPLPLNFPPFGGLGMFGFNQALFNGHQNSFLPPPVPMPPAPGMIIKAGKWVDPSQSRKTSKEGAVTSKKIHKHHFTPHTITGKVFDRTLQTLTEPEGEHKCDFCGNIYNKRASLESHIKRNHNPNLTVKCPECPKLLSCQAAIKKHLLTHRPESEWPYICEFCGKRFQAKGDLPKHFVTTQHREDPRVPKPGTAEWQIVLDRSAVASSSFAPKENNKTQKGKKKKGTTSRKNGDILPEMNQKGTANPINMLNNSSKGDGNINNLLPFPLPHPDTLPMVKEEPDNDGEISNLLYPEITLNSSSKSLSINKISKAKKSSTKGSAKSQKAEPINNIDPFMGLPLQNNMQQNPFLMAYLMNQYMGMNDQAPKSKVEEKLEKSRKKKISKKISAQDESNSSFKVNNYSTGSMESDVGNNCTKQNDADYHNSNASTEVKHEEDSRINEMKEPIDSFRTKSNLEDKIFQDHNKEVNSATQESVNSKTDATKFGSSTTLDHNQENNSKPLKQCTKDNNATTGKPLPSFKTVQNNTPQNEQDEINDEHPPPTPGFNIMDILEEDPILPPSSESTVGDCSFPNANNISTEQNMTPNINETMRQPPMRQQVNGDQLQPQVNLPNLQQNIHDQPISQQSTQHFSQQLLSQSASQPGGQADVSDANVQQVPQQMNPMMGQANMNQWGNGQMDAATMAYWWNANGGNNGGGSGSGNNMPYWWNGGGTGGGGMPPPIL